MTCTRVSLHHEKLLTFAREATLVCPSKFAVSKKKMKKIMKIAKILALHANAKSMENFFLCIVKLEKLFP